MNRSRSAALAALVTSAALAVGVPLAPSATAADPGQSGPTMVLSTGISTFTGLDVAADQATGTAYVGWISSGTGDPERTIHLCVLPAGATGCAGGVLKTTTADWSTAAALHVVVTGPGTVTLVWFHDGSTAGHLAWTTYSGGPTLAAPTESTVDVPDNGSLEDVQLGPDGQLWAVTQDAASITSNVLGVRDGLNGTPTSVPVPFPVSRAQLAFNGSQPILGISHGSQIGEPVRIASGPGWGVSDVAGTWQKGTAFDVVGTSSGARLVASEANAGYRPVSASWNGSTFAGPELTGDLSNCSPVSHDLVTDSSGRIADVTNECEQITVSNMADTRHSGVVRFPSGGTLTGPEVQLATFGNGTGWASWGIQAGGGNTTLVVTGIRLPGLQTTVTTKKKYGSVSLTGPASCLPAVTIGDAVKAKAGKHWKTGKVKLTLDGHKISAKGGSIDGAAFASGSTHTLVAKVAFKPKPKKPHHHHRLLTRGHRGHHHHGHHHGTSKTVTVSLSFRVC